MKDEYYKQVACELSRGGGRIGAVRRRGLPALTHNIGIIMPAELFYRAVLTLFILG